MKNLFIFIICLSWTFSSMAQTDSTSFDTVPFESPTLISIEASVSVRFSDMATAYFKWQAVENAAIYTIKYKAEDDQNWIELQVSTNETTIKNLPLDKRFVWEVHVNESYTSDVGIVSTFPQEEPIAVSSKLFSQLSNWFSDEDQQVDYCDFIQQMDINIYEKLSFIQIYNFDNWPLLDGTDSEILSDWYPPIEGGIENGTCLPKDGGCRCKVITDGYHFASPGKMNYLDWKVNPKKMHKSFSNGSGEDTWVDKAESGAAKFVSLRQNDKNGQMSFTMTHDKMGSNSSNQSAYYSKIGFYLACLRGDGISSNLPESCQCEKPLFINYEYGTNVHVKADKRGGWVSKGATAQAEDLAWVMIRDGKTGDLIPLAAGHVGISRTCNSSWNPAFWGNIIDIILPSVEFYIQSQTGSSLPTTDQLKRFADGIKGLITTKFTIKKGECGTTITPSILAAGVHEYLLKPNEPITVMMFSAYRLRVRGYGSWIAESAIASDYFMVGVVESELTEDIECCSDKFTNYIVGSGKPDKRAAVQLFPTKDIDDRLQDVGAFLSLFGSWRGVPTLPSGIIGTQILGREFAKFNGVSCVSSGSANVIGANYKKGAFRNLNQEYNYYPTLVNDQINIDIFLDQDAKVDISLYNIQGQKALNLFSEFLQSGMNQLELKTKNLSSGIYILNSQIGNKKYANKILLK